jgi:hypothetical protein
MKKIEKTKDNSDFIEELFKDKRVFFENTLLKSDNYCYYISYFVKKDIYDVIIIENNQLVNYEARKKLSGDTLKYFNTLKNDTINDNFGNIFKCFSHSIEFE